MKSTVSEFDFVDAFKQCGRADQFTRSARLAIFEYLENLENDIGEEFELDPIAICCEYSEYADWQELVEQYSLDLDEDADEDTVRDWFAERTSVIEFPGGIVIADF